MQTAMLMLHKKGGLTGAPLLNEFRSIRAGKRL